MSFVKAFKRPVQSGRRVRAIADPQRSSADRKRERTDASMSLFHEMTNHVAEVRGHLENVQPSPAVSKPRMTV